MSGHLFDILDQRTVHELEDEVAVFCMDLRTLAFYTDFLFTDESREFKYRMRAEPDGYRIVSDGRIVSNG